MATRQYVISTPLGPVAINETGARQTVVSAEAINETSPPPTSPTARRMTLLGVGP